VPYSRSYPLRLWLGDWRLALEVISEAHQHIGQVAGPGRPREVGRRLAHAYILQLVADFQAFARDLHDLAASSIVDLSGVDPRYRGVLTTAATEGRQVDRGNADRRALQLDYRRLGLADLNDKLGQKNASWPQDRQEYDHLIILRNAIAHGNQRQLEARRPEGVLDTRTWARMRRPALNRFARALDEIVWEHLRTTFGQDPW
jgi:hypothetical protein